MSFGWKPRNVRLAEILRQQRLRGAAPPGRPADAPDAMTVWPDLEGGDEEAALAPPPAHAPPWARPGRFGWKERLGSIEGDYHGLATRGEGRTWPAGRELLYVVDAAESAAQGGLMLDVLARAPKKTGGWSRPKSAGVHAYAISSLPDPRDRQIVPLLRGAEMPYGYASSRTFGTAAFRHRLSPDMARILMPLVCETGRCRLRVAGSVADPALLSWDPGEPWRFRLLVTRGPGTLYRVTGVLERGTERRPLGGPLALVAGGLVFMEDRVARLDDGGAFPWIAHLRHHGAIDVPTTQANAFLAAALAMPRLPSLELPAELAYEEVAVAPQPRLAVRAPARPRGPQLVAALSFDYGGTIVPMDHEAPRVLVPRGRRLIVRDLAAEEAARRRLRQLGGVDVPYRIDDRVAPAFILTPATLPRLVRQLVAEGWHVEADGRLYRQAGTIAIDVTSGVDWFDLRGRATFGAQSVALPDLLHALQRGESMIQLGDGSFGALPEEWLRTYGRLARFADGEHGALRFRKSQVGLLDALVADLPQVSADALFEKARAELARFDRIEPADPPPGFTGRLRGYQRDGLGWLHFLRGFGFGGCLADDMGLGKTVQVLALLESRRAERAAPHPARSGAPRPSLVVVPRSLVFNWKQEAARFTPALAVLDHTGGGRLRQGERFDAYDLVITTYGTVRRDAAALRDVRFDYVILDEAQMVKNADTGTARAVRVLRGEHRLALSGTPVQNHLGELWSLLEFLNPGLLGSASAFAALAPTRSADPESRELLARAVRPFILRRTKGQVAPDLPARTEQTLYCELDAGERRRYEELREYYRTSLLGRVDREGLGRSKIQVLEALLRLRQAACHPGLLDPSRRSEPSAKLDLLLAHLAEVAQEGHKSLVFSQFTSLLALVRARLDGAGLTYEYLDGRTRDRAARVERFQTDPACPIFLVSLKAGGLGLNLTAAEYVFLLDPWWNPAVEAQAIDRTHRIGQTRPVFAYRLIARDTVEEKVLALQETKRELADAIIKADAGLIRNLTRDDLALLLS